MAPKCSSLSPSPYGLEPICFGLILSPLFCTPLMEIGFVESCLAKPVSFCEDVLHWTVRISQIINTKLNLFLDGSLGLVALGESADFKT